MNYFKKCQWVKVAEDNDNDNYDFFRGKRLKIIHVARNINEHPGYDEGMEGMPLYDLEDEQGNIIDCSLYAYELEKAGLEWIYGEDAMNKHTCPSCGGEGEYLGALLDMSGQEEREYLFWKCLDCRQEWQTKKGGDTLGLEVKYCNVAVCANGHFITTIEPQIATMIKHTCGKWTWKDGDYCIWCGQELNRKEA